MCGAGSGKRAQAACLPAAASKSGVTYRFGLDETWHPVVSCTPKGRASCPASGQSTRATLAKLSAEGQVAAAPGDRVRTA